MSFSEIRKRTQKIIISFQRVCFSRCPTAKVFPPCHSSLGHLSRHSCCYGSERKRRCDCGEDRWAPKSCGRVTVDVRYSNNHGLYMVRFESLKSVDMSMFCIYISQVFLDDMLQCPLEYMFVEPCACVYTYHIHSIDCYQKSNDPILNLPRTSQVAPCVPIWQNDECLSVTCFHLHFLH